MITLDQILAARGLVGLDFQGALSVVGQPFAQGLGVRVALQMTGRTVIRTTRAARLQLHLCCCKLPQACSGEEIDVKVS